MKKLKSIILFSALILITSAASFYAGNKSAVRSEEVCDSANVPEPEEQDTATQDNSKNKSEILTISKTDQIYGDKDAPITIFEYSDYQCPYCVRFQKTVKEIMAAYEGKVKLVYRHYPLSFHKAAKPAAIAAEAAGKQGKFWEFSDLLFENSTSDGSGMEAEDFIVYAETLGLDLDKFKSDQKSKDIVDKVTNDIKGAGIVGVKGTPGSFIVDKNGDVTPLSGAQSFEKVAELLEGIL